MKQVCEKQSSEQRHKTKPCHIPTLYAIGLVGSLQAKTIMTCVRIFWVPSKTLKSNWRHNSDIVSGFELCQMIAIVLNFYEFCLHLTKLSPSPFFYGPKCRVGKNRYSIAIFLTFFQSNTPDPLLFGMSIEYAVFFSFFQVKTIFDIVFQKAMQQQTSKHSEEDY